MRRKNIYQYCLLFIVAIFFFVLHSPADAFADFVDTSGPSLPVKSVIAGHNTCEQCHGRFSGRERFKNKDSRRGRPAKIPARKVDLLCLGCHGPTGISNLKADIHGRQNYVIKRTIGCVTCHDPHDNNPNYLAGQNIKLIGKDKKNRSSNYAGIRTTRSGWQDVVFESRGTDTGAPSLHSFADGDEDNNGKLDGICEVCHTETKYHRNSPGATEEHYTGSTCTDCHAHVNQFLAFSDAGPVGSFPINGSVLDSNGNPISDITLFLDINGNGVYDPGEPTAKTDKNGNFFFEGQTDKRYPVLVMANSIPYGYSVTVTTTDNKVTITFTPRPVTVEGYVWSDVNLNGSFDKDDAGLYGAVVFNDTNGNGTYDVGEPVASADITGFYSLTGFPGPYSIHVDKSSIPAGYELITDNVPFNRFIGPGMVLADINFGYKKLLQADQSKNTLIYPTRLAWKADGGYLVADYYRNAVFIYDATGKVTGQLKKLDKPLGVATDAAGRIYVGNVGRRNVEIYNAEGVLQTVLGQGEIEMPNDLTFDRKGRLYVADSRNKHIRVFNADGTDALTIGQVGPNDSRFMFPNALAIHYRMENSVEVGELYVSDSAAIRIKVFDLEGNFLRSFGSQAYMGGSMGTKLYADGRFANLQSIKFDQNGMLHVLDSYMDRVQIFDPVTGTYSNQYYDTFASADQNPELPMDIAISASGQVIVSSAKLAAVNLIYTVQ